MVGPMLGHGVTLVLGGARSGKSAFAEKLLTDSPLSCIYLATGRVWDDEMGARVKAHKDRRGNGWTTIEEPVDLATVLCREARPGHAILVDCLTLWVTNLMMAEASIDAAFAELTSVLDDLPCPVVFVSNEVGLGIVPDNRMAREFRDHAGRLHQDIAAIAQQVYFVAAGLPLTLKG